MVRTLSPLIALLLVGGVCWVALGRPEPRADLTYANPQGIHTLDPARMSWTNDLRVALNLWEGLTTWNPVDLTPIAGVAKHPPAISDDGLQYTFTLRPDARWSNGDPVTSADFIRGWRRGMEPGTGMDYTFFFTDHIVGAKAYVDWRREAVAILVPLSRLAQGWEINAEQKKALGDRFPGNGNNWRQIHKDALQRHAAEMGERFDRVGVSAPDEHTLIVRLNAPCPYFLDLLAMPIFLPIHKSISMFRRGTEGLPITAQGLVIYDPQWTKPEDHAGGYEGLVTNGAYRLAGWSFKRRLRLAKNPYFHDADSVRCRTIDMVVLENVSASIMAYERGEIDFLPSMNVPYDHEIARLAETGARPDFVLSDVLATYFLNFNCVSETVGGVRNPFLDPRVRKAFALAVNKEQIVRDVLRRGDRIAGSFVPPGVIPGYEPPSGLVHNADAARALLAEAGFPDGVGLPVIDLLYTPSDSRIVQALSRMWAVTLGVRVNLRGKESRTLADDKAHHRFMIARGNWYADYNDPTTFLDCLLRGNGNNDSGYANEAYDALLEAANGERDATRRSELLRRAEAIIVEDDLPILPILFYREPIAISPRVHGLHANARLWFPFRYVTVTP